MTSGSGEEANDMKPFWVLFPLSLKIDFSKVAFEQIEHKRCGIGVSTEGAGKLNGTVSSNRESSWYRKRYSAVSHRLLIGDGVRTSGTDV